MNSDNLNETKPQRSYWTPILCVGLVVAFGLIAYQNSQADVMRHQVAAFQQDVAALRTSMSASDGALQKTLNALQDELVSARKDTSSRLSQVQVGARKHADELSTKLASDFAKRHDEQQQAVAAEFAKVKESSAETTDKIAGISTEVGTVKTEVASTKSELDKTISDLTRVRGDMGVMSGLIATNGKEIQALREVGDRNIYEFTLTRSAGPQKVGDITVALKKADIKRNKYTMDVVADDKRIEKKDKNTNEPVQFYVASKARQPYEIVVNEVKKDTVTGYLATPKVSLARSTQPAAN
jgi:chromosome segregation ATPase